jgi:hypothetical protein
MEKYNKNLLILGAGLDQVPGIQKAKDLGCYTIVLDGNSNSIGKEISDEFYTVNIKDYIEIETFLKNYNSKRIDGVIAYGVDIPTIIAKTADFLGVNYTIPTKSAIISEDKYESKIFMEQNNISIPKFKLIKNLEDIYIFAEKNGFPLIIKPVDNSASRGIIFINNVTEIEKAYYYALKFSKNKKIIVESYLSGNQVSSETLVINGKIFHLGFLDRNYDKNEMFYPNIIEDGGDMPSVYMKNTHIKQLTKFYEVIAKKLNIKKENMFPYSLFGFSRKNLAEFQLIKHFIHIRFQLLFRYITLTSINDKTHQIIVSVTARNLPCSVQPPIIQSEALLAFYVPFLLPLVLLYDYTLIPFGITFLSLLP